jgi:ABC-type transport system substrate-binding protein
MSLSRYDRDRDGRCDSSVCRGVEAVVRNDPPFYSTLASDIASDLRAIGIDLSIRNLDPDAAFGAVGDPARQTPMSIGDGWSSFYPSASNFFPDIWGSDGLGSLNFTLVGATPRDLRRWGYSVRSVPSVDDRIQECIGLVFKDQIECWADLDTFATEEVAAMVPVFFQLAATLVSARVRHFSFDQSTFAPALDQIALAR